ncbi:UxaA family hydrolase [Anaerotignum sp.]|uniref:UxaA family hydrolase n=1 Tax=Anaerotignum sp. TaxID=2039241 RepID=UPI002714FAD2|nr:altronate dehydratase family protein [Anaerotignum sp.]
MKDNMIIVNPKDSVAVVLCDIKKNEVCQCGEVTLIAKDDIPFGHKIALFPINAGENVIKYGSPIGHATKSIEKGQHVHVHNAKTNLAESGEYKFSGTQGYDWNVQDEYFMGYRRKDGLVGVRNEIWIVPTVGCVNKTAERLVKEAEKMGIHALAVTHPYGCSQMGEDQTMTQKTLAALVKHPNAGGVLVLSLGCENNNLDVFQPFLGEYDSERIRFMITQEEEDEMEKGLALLKALSQLTEKDKREKVPLRELIIGFKCGGSDAFSGITANPLCGRLTDLHTSAGGRAILTEVPEMFGAEDSLFARCESKEVFDEATAMINAFKNYYVSHNQVVYENPSPGNKAGGITTLEEKSLGCIQKGGQATVTDILEYAKPVKKPGLSLLTGPGNDMVSCTNLAASGAHIILFTTGRGTPFGTVVPTLKISSNSALAEHKANWIDFNAGMILEGTTFEEAAKQLMDLLKDTASGKLAKNEENDYKEIAIFKDGVTL